MKTTHPLPDWSLFDRALQQDIAQSEQLLALLQSERKALEAREYSDLDNLLAQKKTCIELLEANATRRQRWLAQHGLSDDFAALSAVKQQAPEVAARWKTAATTWKECQSANQINDQICRRTRVVVERVLDILRGQTANSATYDAKGYSQRTPGGRTISSA